MREFVSAYGPKVQVGVECRENKTRQEFKEDCDINLVLKRYKTKGILPIVTKAEARYGDLTGVDFQKAQDVILSANSAYMALPAKIRRRFKDAGEFLSFLDDPENVDELVSLGLATRREAAELDREQLADGGSDQGGEPEGG